MPYKSKAARDLAKKKERQRKKNEAARREAAKAQKTDDSAEKAAAAKARRDKAKATAPVIEERDETLSSKIYSAKGEGTIFIGRKANAQDSDHLKENKINCVLNMAKEIPIPAFYKQEKIVFKKMECEDKSTFPLIDHWEEATAFIDDMMRKGKFILVHCQEGRSRSASTVAAYFIKYKNMSKNTAMGTICARRHLVQPNT